MWSSPPADLCITGNQVHIWCARLDVPPEEVHRLEMILSEDERIRAHRFRFEAGQRRYIASRGVLRSILGRYLNVSPLELHFHYGEYGKPSLAGDFTANPYEFNLAHSHELALFGFTRGVPVGVDLEYLKTDRDYDKIAARYFSKLENEIYCSLPPSERPGAFFNAWTRKEAFIKAIGQGLTLPLDSFDVTLTPGKPAQLLRVGDDPGEASQWYLESFAPDPDYVGAVAVRSRGLSMTCWCFSG
jgi:4'-phosphopantetheinyl transferase